MSTEMFGINKKKQNKQTSRQKNRIKNHNNKANNNNSNKSKKQNKQKQIHKTTHNHKQVIFSSTFCTKHELNFYNEASLAS